MASGYGRSSGGGPSSSGSHRPSFSFLFVVNRLKFTDNPYPPDSDRWGNMLPPCDKRAYTREKASRVMRYKDGRVTLAEEYFWDRPDGWHTTGFICGPSQSAAQQPTPYKVQTVFSCNPFIPIITITDDMTTRNVDRYDGPNWELLRFAHGTNTYPGVSFATCGQVGPHQYVAGSSPSWIPNLVPASYLSPFNAQQSQGLGGDLPLVLALMSFWHPWGMDHHERMEKVFYGRHPLWKDSLWRGDPRDEPNGYSNTEHLPNGLVVQVSFDDVYNPVGSTVEAMRGFEMSRIVRDYHWT